MTAGLWLLSNHHPRKGVDLMLNQLVSVTSSINLFIIVIYRPPGPLGNFLDEMDTLLSVFPSDSTPLTVLGDFNLPSDKLHSSGLLNSFSLSFNSCPPTHKEGIVLDLVFTHPSPATDMTVTTLYISDHHLVSFSITLPVLPKRNSQHLSLTRRNLHSISPSSVASCTLCSLPDHESFSFLPLDSATDTLLSSLSSTMDLLCLLSTIRRKNSSPAPWLSDVLRNNRRELRSAARKWKKSKLDTHLIFYRTLLFKFSLDVTSAKTSFYKEKLETSAQDPRKLHNIFSSLLNPPAPPSPSSLTAEDFATFYTEKIERICQNFTSLPTSPTSHSQHCATPSLTQLSTVASEEVLRITRSCNPTTCPLDPIPSAMLQTISPDLLPFITTVINESLTSGHVPIAFKKATVIPILKKLALYPSDISNHRPVSLLSFLSKILERAVCNQLSDYLMQNNLHDPNQSGFKAAHSTESALLAVTEKLHAARSAKLSSVLILLDLSAAFDTVNHKTLLSTLRSLGICGTAWEWFASYLDGRSYQLISSTCGIPDTGKGRELADVMERRKVDILCVQETRWKGSKARSIGAGFKLFYYGVDSKRNGVGVVLKEEFVRNVLEVKRVSDRMMSLKLEIEGVMLNVVSGYVPQVGCELEEKERFWSELDEVMESIPTAERVVIGADFNGHVGEGNTGDEEVMGKFGVKERNLEGQMVVDFAKRMDMAVVNTYFQKREEHRVTYKSGGRSTQVDYILCRRGNLKEISDCKVVVGESVARQHRMVVCRMTLMVCKKKRSKIEIEKKTKWWKLKKEECCEEFRKKLRQALGGQVVLPDDWETTAEVIRETGRKVLGVSSGRRKEDKETWWWNEEVQDSIQRKRLAKKKWDMDRTEENSQEYKELQRRVKREVSKAKQKAYD
ncbi:hypothetical protein QTP70_004385 [Hemibagrus guttatus]|uniref:Reverse transcriptase domain-containing protein n=1 Tax=Hemibagrus guttatus TaxID=175788 RepID=A0AAE0RI20_9TELE|nr:hypothetical protein QTP70_004385 [Hemibagrus guttatus]